MLLRSFLVRRIWRRRRRGGGRGRPEEEEEGDRDLPGRHRSSVGRSGLSSVCHCLSRRYWSVFGDAHIISSLTALPVFRSDRAVTHSLQRVFVRPAAAWVSHHVYHRFHRTVPFHVLHAFIHAASVRTPHRQIVYSRNIVPPPP